MDAALHTRRSAAPSRSALTAAACTSAAGGAGWPWIGSGRPHGGGGRSPPGDVRAERGGNAPGAARPGALAAAAVPSARPPGGRRDRVVLRRRAHRRGHHRRDRGAVGRAGVVNEYRAEKAAEALHSRITHRAVAVRSGQFTPVNVDRPRSGRRRRAAARRHRAGGPAAVDDGRPGMRRVSADRRVAAGAERPGAASRRQPPRRAGQLRADGHRRARRDRPRRRRGDRDRVPVRAGSASGWRAPGWRPSSRSGLRRFSMLLVYVAAGLTTSIFAINVALHRPVLDALLFSLAIAVGITPQLLPAVVSTSLAAGSRQLARREGAGQAAGLHRGPRRRRRPVHRQDRHPDRGPDQLHAGRRRSAGVPVGARCCAGLACVEAELDEGGRRRSAGNALDVGPVELARRGRRVARRRGTGSLAHPAVRPRAPAGLGARRRTRGSA